MTKAEFDEKLKMVSHVVGNEQAGELFISSYESLLKELKAMPCTLERFEMASRMRRLLDLQMQHEMNLWLILIEERT